MTGSNLARAATEMSDVVAMSEDYKGLDSMRPRLFIRTIRWPVPDHFSWSTIYAREGFYRKRTAYCRGARLETIRQEIVPHFDFAGALRYFSNGISKYISSFPLASRTPVR